MSKNHRGTGIRELAAHGRGTCPICKSTGIKVLYEKEIEQTLMRAPRHDDGARNGPRCFGCGHAAGYSLRSV